MQCSKSVISNQNETKHVTHWKWKSNCSALEHKNSSEIGVNVLKFMRSHNTYLQVQTGIQMQMKEQSLVFKVSYTCV